MKMTSYQPKTGAACHCKRGQQRDNCPDCEGTGMRIDFKAIRARVVEVKPTMGTKEIKAAFDALDRVFYAEMRNHAEALLDLCKTEERGHRGFAPDFAKYHTSDTISVNDAAKLFAVKRAAEYILAPDKMPKGQDYLHTQKSCFIAAGIADEFRQRVIEAWTAFNLDELAKLNYTDFVKVNSNA